MFHKSWINLRFSKEHITINLKLPRTKKWDYKKRRIGDSEQLRSDF